MIDISAAAFDAFSAPLLGDEVAARFAAEARLAKLEAQLYIDAIISEAHLALRLLGTVDLDSGKRVLEVGAGAGLLTGFLQVSGVNIVGVEPVQDGFDATPILARIVRETTGGLPNILAIPARELEPEKHGLFDVIVSINVVEHFQPLTPNLAALARVMAPAGVQIYTCPNYYVPYEPHFGIPLLPFAPALTTHLWRRKLRDTALWRSLNFITVGDVRRYATENGLEVRFETGAMARTLRRLRQEPSFAVRHPPTLRWAAEIAYRTGLLALMRHLPAALVTPMTVLLTAKSPSRASS